MPMIAAPVATWAIGAGTAAATALGATAGTALLIGEAVGAVAGAVAAGAATGAVIGAATAIVSGGNVLKGALKGAAIGGITAGVASGLGMATGLATAESQLAGMGVKTASAAAPSAAAPAATSDLAAIGQEVEGVGKGTLSSAPVPQEASEKGSGWFDGMSDAKAKVVAGLAEGGMKGLGQVGASMMESESQKDLAESQAKQLKERIAANTPGTFKAQTANIKVPDWWNKYVNPSVTAGVAV